MKIKEHMKSVEDAFDNLRGSGLLSEDAPVQRTVLSNIWTDLYQIGITEDMLATLEFHAQEVCARMSWSITPNGVGKEGYSYIRTGVASQSL